ncbi:P-loop containing nucleoside triphosphate hydrolases superfamily protein [Theobroma cacao]|uniref:P-loop containing nucleoside triphosphate hydrolases superfamily protein n=1 Tax=Theobroma cacao TaxID=3641 RepID=A0A061GK04_THECC|nr:P-loop containing nucleoside triphosphate hydrolases superfamily protein [Theobroma cacao]
MNIAVGARAGVFDDLFAGNFLGRDSDIVFDYRQKVTRSFEYLQGDYYIAPAFMDKVVCHIVKNFLAHLLNVKIPLILAIWGGKGQGKSFQTELIFQAMGIEPVIMSAGELESERAGEPGKLIRERYSYLSLFTMP